MMAYRQEALAERRGAHLSLRLSKPLNPYRWILARDCYKRPLLSDIVSVVVCASVSVVRLSAGQTSLAANRSSAVVYSSREPRRLPARRLVNQSITQSELQSYYKVKTVTKGLDDDVRVCLSEEPCFEMLTEG